MDDLFNVQKNLLKKQKSLLNIINTSDQKIIKDIINTNIITEKTEEKTEEKTKQKNEKKIKQPINEILKKMKL